ncbi:MAG: flavodoxin [Bacteroidota bacterium]
MSFYTDNKVGLFVGSDTGNTEEIGNMLLERWSISEIELIEASKMTVEDYDRFQIIIIGLPTWYDGELQSDFEAFFDEFKTIDFSGKAIAMFGLGDQTGYPEFFVDGLGILGEVMVQNGGYIFGMWPNEGYEFDQSKGLYDDNFFYGLALDFENQQDLNESRLEAWIQQIEKEIEEMVEA